MKSAKRGVTRKPTARKVSKKKVSTLYSFKVKARKAPAKKAKRHAAKRKPNAAFMKPMTPSASLAAVVGSSPMPRTEVTSKLWGYIKKNNLQDKTNRRMINADDKLRQVFGGKKQVSMFEMSKLVNRNLGEGTNSTGPKVWKK